MTIGSRTVIAVVIKTLQGLALDLGLSGDQV